MAAASKKQSHPIDHSHAEPAPVDAVAQARAVMQASGDAVKVARSALVLAQRRHEDARAGLARAIQDRFLAEGV